MLAVGVGVHLPAHDRRPATSSPSLPADRRRSRSGRSAGCSASSPQRGRATTGSGGAAGHRRDGVRRAAAPPPSSGPEVAGDGPRLPLRPGQPLLDDVTFDRRPGRTVAPWWGDRVGQEHAHQPRPAGRPDRGPDPRRRRRPARPRARRASPPPLAVVAQTAFLFDDTVRGNVTLGADVSDAGRLQAGAARRAGERLRRGAPARPRHPPGRARHLALRRPAAADLAGPRAGPPPTGSSSSTTPPRRSTRGRGAIPGRAADRRPRHHLVVVAYRKATISLADEVVHLGTAASPTGAPRRAAERAADYARLVNAYEVATEVGAELRGSSE